MQHYQLPRSPWYNGGHIEITLPAGWEVSFIDILADFQAPLDRSSLKKQLCFPVAGPPLQQLARGKRKAVIIFDDLSRPTDAAAVAPLVVEELLGAGIGEERISFVAALGGHAALTLSDFTKKLGVEIVSRFPVYNHTPYENCSYVGTTSSGVPLYINDEVLSADLKIGIGSVLPHSFNGFGGGGKIILPGVAGMESIYRNHRAVLAALRAGGKGMLGITGEPEQSRMQADIDEAMQLIGFNFLINLLPDSRGRSVGMVAGDPVRAYRQGVELARRLYRIDYHGGADIVIANACAKVNEALNALLLGAVSLKEQGGDMVLVADCPDGQVFHYLLGQCGQKTGGRLWSGETYPARLKRGYLLSSYPGQRFGFFSRFQECRRWEKILGMLQEEHGEKARVVIYKDGTMQYFGRMP